MLIRRDAIGAILGMMVGACAAGRGLTDNAPVNSNALAHLENRAGGRLGACVLDTRSGSGFGWRMHERFAHCSSFKLSLAAMTLGRGESGEVDLAKVLRWSQDDLITYSPITEAHVNSGLSLRDLARAALVASDNTAANLLLDYFGGPSALTEFWRSIGDDVSRLDRYEPELNLVPDGTELDTTSPFAMARTVNELLFGNSQHEEVRSQIRAWMMEVKTGLNRLRAGFPEDWVAGDKTGTGIHETRQTYVDLAFGGPVDRKPIVVAAYFEPHLPAKAFAPDILGVLAEVGRIAASETRDPRVRDVFG